MITLNTEELLALNGVIDAQPLYGLYLPAQKEEEKERLKGVLTSLEEKEVIKNEKLTDKGFALLRLIEEYKTSETHLFINQIRLGYLDEEHVVVIEKQSPDQYYVAKMQKVMVEMSYVESSAYLKKAHKKRFIPYKSEKMSQEELDQELDDEKWTELMVIQKHKNGQMYDQRIYYMTEEKGYCYDYVEKERTQKGPKDIREELMELLEIGEVENG